VCLAAAVGLAAGSKPASSLVPDTQQADIAAQEIIIHQTSALTATDTPNRASTLSETSKQDADAREMDEAEEILGTAVVSDNEPSLVVKPGEQALLFGR
jgi:hypothetical protein